MCDFGDNKYAVDTLNAFLKFKNPKFAVLITGKWGCGKTWFIREYIKYAYHLFSEINEFSIQSLKFCYVSLFGLTTLTEIDSAIFKSFHPFLGSDICGQVGEFIVDKLPMAVSIPINKKDIKKAGNFIKSLSIKQCRDIVLILDDFERCKIDKHILLGYINNQIDEYNAKVIIIANAEKIEDKDKFIIAKEKVIGQTITITPNIKQVFSYYIDTLQESEVKKILKANINLLEEIFINSNSHNLRHITKLIFEFSRLYSCINEKYKEYPDFINNILISSFVMSIETHENKQELDKIFDKNSLCWPTINPFSKDESSKCVYNFYKKYQLNELYFSPRFWDKFLLNGIIIQDELDESYARYKASLDTREESIPLVLWDLFRMDENIFDDLLPKMKMELANKKYRNIGIFLHAAGILLSCSKYNIINDSMDNIVTFIKRNMDNLSFEIDKNYLYDSSLLFSGCFGREYHESNSPEFIEIFNFAKKLYRDQYSESVSTNIGAIFEKLDISFDESIKLLINLKNDFSGFFVNNIDYDKFIDNIYKLNNKNLRIISSILYELIKIHSNSSYNKSFDIIPWKDQLAIDLRKKLHKSKHPLCKISMEVFIDDLEKFNK